MSKSYGNAIGIEEPPEEIFGKIMSISDELMLRYYELLTGHDLEEIKSMDRKTAKQRLAEELVEKFHGAAAGRSARASFDIKHPGRVVDHSGAAQAVAGLSGNVTLVKAGTLLEALVEAKLAPSKGEARRLIQQGAVDLDGHPVKDATQPLPRGTTVQVKVGKRRYAALQRH
jgi:tyrosyl-tRNA synthetase